MTERSEPTFRLADLDDARAMLEVIEAAFESWPSIEVNAPPLDHLRWKMAPPELEPPHDILELDGRVAGVRLQWRNRLQLADREFIAESGADYAIHPDFQGRGLSRRFSEHLRRRRHANPLPGISFLSNSPQIRHMNDPDYIERPVSTWYRPSTRRERLILALRDRGLIRRARSALTQLGTRKQHLPDGVRIEVLERFDERVDSLFERARQAFEVIFFRRADYLNWRFQRPPSGDHIILGLIGGDGLLGYAVVKRSHDRGDLMDLLWDPAVPAALPALVHAAIAELRGTGASGVTCWLPTGHEAEPTLRRAGFTVVGTQTLLLGSTTSGESPPEAIETLRDLTRSMHVTMSDFDHA